MSTHANRVAHQLLDIVPSIMRTIRAEMRSHTAPDLSVPQFRTLAFVNRHSGCSLSDAADHIGLTLPSMSKLVDGLVVRKFVIRDTHAGDRRRITLALTARGKEILEAARESTLASLAERLSALDDRDLQTVVEAMGVLAPIFAFESTRNHNGNS